MSDVSDLTGRMRRQAKAAGKDLPKMMIREHLEDAAGQLEAGNQDGAERHLRAAMQTLTPRNLTRHGLMTDAKRKTAQSHLALLDRHLLGVRDLADMNASAGEQSAGPKLLSNASEPRLMSEHDGIQVWFTGDCGAEIRRTA